MSAYLAIPSFWLFEYFGSIVDNGGLITMDNAEPKSYMLSDDESRAIFERDIVPAELGHLSATAELSVSANGDGRTPLAVLLVGQTGAGKTRTAPAIKSAIERLRGRSHLAHFVADTYKTYHPSYTTLLATRPGLASQATGPDARRWLNMAASVAAARRADVLLESAARYPEDFAQLACLFRTHGYRVEVAVMAVPAPLSRLGILTRFYEKLPEVGPGGRLPLRLTPRKVHDESYAGLLEAAAFVDSGQSNEGGTKGRGIVDQVVVVRRDNVVAYANERIPDGAWKRELGTEAAIRQERGRPLTVYERMGAEFSLGKLRAMNIPGLESQLKEIEGLLKPLLDTPNDSEYAPLRPLSLPNSVYDEQFNSKAGLRLGV
ncbi:zeta toxin-domain-containing protein [Hypoxylon trugodes]|uniref:zeta toxin-domain-containing protein n=1 Tax=Hypoxylon trugodes TaxID=326681 RepID=UPI002190CF3B|nr:zeta toxin-domain-containing protein [Hypoxylon trugodes]KAI1393751.1 zeta toxin-domain-containing protein [Hypoxylon trugodes]